MRFHPIISVLFLFLYLLSGKESDAQGSWTQKANFGGGARCQAAGFSIGTKGYIGTGRGFASSYVTDFWEWDQLTNTWTQKASFVGPGRSEAVGFSIGTKGYIGTGEETLTTFSNDLWEWDQASNTWSPKNGFSAPGRDNAVGFSMGAKAYIGTGIGIGGEKQDFWEWDQISDAWTQKANFAGSSRQGAFGFSLGTKGYIGLGAYSPNTFYKDLWEYDPGTNNWLKRADFPGNGRAWGATFTTNGKAFICTGRSQSAYFNELWEWDQATDTWIQKPNFGGIGRVQPVGFSIGSMGYTGTGYAGGNLQDFWEFNSLGPSNDHPSTATSLTPSPFCTYTTGTSSYAIPSTLTVTPCGGNPDDDVWYSFVTWGSTSAMTITVAPSAGYDAVIDLRNSSMVNVACRNAGGNGVIETLNATGLLTNATYYVRVYHSGAGSGSGNFDICVVLPPSNDNPASAISLIPDSSCVNITGSSMGASQSAVQDTACGGDPDDDVWFSFLCPATVTTVSVTITPSSSYDAVVEAYNGSKKHCINSGGNGAMEVLSVTGLVPGALCSLRVYHAGAGSGSGTFDICAAYPTVSPLSWTAVANFGGTARDLAVAFSIGAKGYLGTGEDGVFSFRDDFWEYDQATNVWTQKASIIGAYRCWATGFSIGNKGYVGTGTFDIVNNGHLSDLSEYDPSSNTWSAKATFGGGVRYGAIGFSIGTKGYIGLGDSSGATSKKDFWEWDQISNSWTQKANSPVLDGTIGAAAFSVGGKGYVGSGLWEYDPSANSWTEKAGYGGTAGWGLVGLAVNGSGFMGLGGSSSGYSKEFWQYDPSSDTWFMQTNYPGLGRANSCAFAIGNNGYVGTGFSGGPYHKDIWRFTGGNIATDVDGLNPNLSLFVFPNPTSGIISLNSSFAIREIVIYDLSGKKVYSSAGQLAGSVIDISHQPAGVYLLKVNADNEAVVRKIVIQK